MSIHACTLADQGKREDLEVFVCCATPECPASLAYQIWQKVFEHSLALQCGPIRIVRAPTFNRNFGRKATERFMISKGMPQHFSAWASHSNRLPTTRPQALLKLKSLDAFHSFISFFFPLTNYVYPAVNNPWLETLRQRTGIRTAQRPQVLIRLKNLFSEV